MSDPIDFAGIVKCALWTDSVATTLDNDMANNDVAVILAAKLPALCPDCGGTGYTGARVRGGCLCRCPNAPTIGQMLREWQALTALAEYAKHHYTCPAVWVGDSPPYGDCTCGLDAARAALKAVQP